MKTQIKKELHNRSLTELSAQLKEAKEAQRVLRLDQEMGKLKNTSSLGNNRAEIAVISTIINEKIAKDKFVEVVKADGKKEVSAKEKPAAGKAKTKSAAKATDDKKGGKNE